MRQTERGESNSTIYLVSVDGLDHAVWLNAEFLLHTALSNENGMFYATIKKRYLANLRRENKANKQKKTEKKLYLYHEILKYMHLSIKIIKNNETSVFNYAEPTKQLSFKINFRKVDQHTEDKRVINPRHQTPNAN